MITFLGFCHCGASLVLNIDNESQDLYTVFEAEIVGGDSINCKKRQLRGIERKKIGNELKDESVDVYRTSVKRQLQQDGDPDPPHLYNDRVYRQAKAECVRSQYLHKDPLEALKIMKRIALGQNIIHQIGCDPFFINIFSSHQIRVYNDCVSETPLLIDSTTGVARKLELIPGVKSHTLALHIGVINCKYGQLAVFEGITERQDTVSIEQLLKRFLQGGASYPKHVVRILSIRYSLK